MSRTFRCCILAAALALLAGCGGATIANYQSGNVDVNKTWDSYNPQAPSIVVPAWRQALAGAPLLEVGGFKLAALDRYNRPDPVVLDSLRLSVRGGEVRVEHLGGLNAASLYLLYDADRLHPAVIDAGQAGAIGAAFRADRGVLALGITAKGGALLRPGQLARIGFAAGTDTAARHASFITQDNRSAVRNLAATDNGDQTVTLQWNERNTGDYDLNGEVNVADLTRIGLYFNQSTDPGQNPNSAKVEVADGDDNGLITLADITPISFNFGSFITGYNVYRTTLATPDENPDPTDTGRWTKIENTIEPSGPSAPRDYNGQQTRLLYTFIDAAGSGDFAWYVAPTGQAGSTPPEGKPSNVMKLQTGPPPAQLDFEIQAPATELLQVNDEFYIAIKITGATGLFSANVRFEYDGSLVQFEEGVAAYAGHTNLLEPPLFLAVDNAGTATSPYVLIGFNATQTSGTPVKDGDGYLAYFKFKALAPGINAECFRFPQSTNFIWLWGAQYGVALTPPPVLGAPQNVNIA